MGAKAFFGLAVFCAATVGCAQLSGLSDLQEIDDGGNVVVDSSEGDTLSDGETSISETGDGAPEAEAACDDGGVGSCGAACRACSSTNVATPTCSDQGTCTSTCNNGFLNCTTPSAPDPDDGCETPEDGSNCGGCGKTCDSTHSDGATCSAGACVYTGCKQGFVDCDKTNGDFDGCETPSNTVDNCGGCGNTCDTTNSSNATCDGTTCVYGKCKTGFADCDTTAPDTDGCETPVDPSNCAGCGKTCDVIESVGAACVGGTCTYTSCKPGFADCNTSPPNTDGCESQLNTPQHCLACGNTCDTSNSVGAACDGVKGCTYTGCKPGFGDCITTAPNTDGCETALNSVLACTACGVKCDSTNSIGASCGSTSCQYTGCKAGFGDCDTTAPDANGCETKLNSTTNCGDCGRGCSLTNATSTSCSVVGSSATCIAICKAGFGNCNLPNSPAADDGCETPLTTTNNCGACGVACDTTSGNSVGASCNGTSCTYAGCQNGFGDCNKAGGDADGCETPLDTVNNCGGCGIKCDTATSTGAACIGGKCVYGGCVAGFGDCDTSGSNANGCETSLSSTSACGACGASCDTTNSNTPSCSTTPSPTTCKYASCAANHADCTKTAPDLDGCETATNTTSNCGGCGNVCSLTNASAASCTGTKCGYTCTSGFGDCNAATAPDLDGCETSITTTSNCGGCGRACSGTGTNHVATPSCSGGVCNSTCAAGFTNCKTPAAPNPDDGCECPGLVNGSMTSCCATQPSGCGVTHVNCIGTCSPLGQSYWLAGASPDDGCRPTGTTSNPSTYDLAMATAARGAYVPATGSYVDSAGVCGSDDVLCRTFTNTSGTAIAGAVWAYDGTTVGHVFYSTVKCGTGAQAFCCCPATGDPTWN